MLLQFKGKFTLFRGQIQTFILDLLYIVHTHIHTYTYIHIYIYQKSHLLRIFSELVLCEIFINLPPEKRN